MLTNRLKTFLEIAAVFVVFCLVGAWQPPDVNEAHYISKAIHYWNPEWVQGDPFLESRDAHWTFYFVFGWLTFFCSPTAMAWIGRIAAWGLLAWSWQRLSYALIPTRWVAIPTALALAYYIESFHMAGEWLIGGIEGKSLAYPFVFFALEAILRRKWNRAGIFLGIACAFHVLVGGWVTLIAGVLFCVSGDWRRGKTVAEIVGAKDFSPLLLRLPPSFPWIGLIVGGSIALCGLIPVLMLNVGVSAETINEANQIYVFKRLQHHLVPYLIKETFLLRFALLTVIWILLCRQLGGGREQRMFNGFIWGTLALSAIGIVLAYALPSPPKGLKLSAEFLWSAELLRFYWFRLADIAVPMGVAIGGTWFCLSRLNEIRTFSIPSLSRVLTVSAIIAAIYLTATYLCFGYFKMSPADQSAPWAITLLVCLGLFSLCPSCLCERKHVVSHEDAKGLVLALFYAAIAFYAPLTILPKYVDLRTHSGQCRSDTFGPAGKRTNKEWQDMCHWIKENTPATAKFWIPRDGQTFKWHARRADIGDWKNIPQDAESIVRWWQSMQDLYRYKNAEGNEAEDRLMTTLLLSKTEEDIASLQQRYGFDYILCAQAYEMPTHSTLELVYENDVYCLYYVRRPEPGQTQ